MRLLGTAVASLALHMLLLWLPAGTSPFSSVNQASSVSPQQTARLVVTLKSESSGSQQTFLTSTESPNEETAPPTEELLAEGEQNKPSSPFEKSADSPGIKPAIDSPPHYYTRNELDRPPRMADDISEKDGALDLALRGVNEHGSVVLELWITDRGTVEKSEIIGTDLSKAVASIVKDNFDLARFIPARLNKQAVHSKLTIEFQVKEKREDQSLQRRENR